MWFHLCMDLYLFYCHLQQSSASSSGLLYKSSSRNPRMVWRWIWGWVVPPTIQVNWYRMPPKLCPSSRQIKPLNTCPPSSLNAGSTVMCIHEVCQTQQSLAVASSSSSSSASHSNTISNRNQPAATSGEFRILLQFYLPNKGANKQSWTHNPVGFSSKIKSGVFMLKST